MAKFVDRPEPNSGMHNYRRLLEEHPRHPFNDSNIVSTTEICNINGQFKPGKEPNGDNLRMSFQFSIK